MSVSSTDPNQRVIYDLVQGLITPAAAWVGLAVVVAVSRRDALAARGREAAPAAWRRPRSA